MFLETQKLNTNKKYILQSDKEESQHTMIDFLKQYDSSLTQEQYESIAWEGLKGTESWNSKSNQEKQNISNIYSSWKYSSGNNCN